MQNIIFLFDSKRHSSRSLLSDTNKVVESNMEEFCDSIAMNELGNFVFIFFPAWLFKCFLNLFMHVLFFTNSHLKRGVLQVWGLSMSVYLWPRSFETNVPLDLVKTGAAVFIFWWDLSALNRSFEGNSDIIAVWNVWFISKHPVFDKNKHYNLSHTA